MSISVQLVQSSLADLEEIRRLFKMLSVELDVDFCFQGFQIELETLPGKYARPTGGLYLAYVNNEVAGCAAFKQIGPYTCELKRFFVLPKFRGLGVSKLLLNTCLQDAVRAGYTESKLDTLARLPTAINLYQSHGFKVCEKYYDNPLEGVVYMCKQIA
jgi:GNAT superfamily N-acetyltransferase